MKLRNVAEVAVGFAPATILTLEIVAASASLWPILLLLGAVVAGGFILRSWWAILAIAGCFSLPLFVLILTWSVFTPEFRVDWTQGDFSGNEGMMFVPVFYVWSLIVVMVAAAIGVSVGKWRSMLQ